MLAAILLAAAASLGAVEAERSFAAMAQRLLLDEVAPLG